MKRMITVFALLAAAHVEATPNRCLQLDGTGEALIFGTVQNLATNFTVACWFQAADPARVQQTLLAQRGSSGNTGWALRLSQGTVSLALNDGTISFTQIGNATVADTYWHNLGATYDGGVASLYLDAALVAQGPVRYRPQPSVYPVTVGAEDIPGDPRRLVGCMDEVQLWSAALSSTAMAALPLHALAGSEPGLVGYWTFTTTTDIAAGGNSVSLQSGADLITEQPGLQVRSFGAGIVLTLPLQPPGAGFQLLHRTTLADPWLADPQTLPTGTAYQWIRFTAGNGRSGFWAVEY